MQNCKLFKRIYNDKEKSIMKNENYINIQGWMINQLKLRGNELILYAIIYGFSQDGQSEYFGSQRYISHAMGVSLPTVNKTINSLLDKGFIIKTKESHYLAVKETLTHKKSSVKETLTQCSRNFNKSVKETLTNNNTNNKYNNNIYPFENFWSIYPVKKAKKVAEQKWNKLKPDIQKLILSDVPKRFQQDAQWKKGYIPHPTTYLNQERWNDEISREQNGKPVYKAPEKPILSRDEIIDRGVEMLRKIKEDNPIKQL